MIKRQKSHKATIVRMHNLGYSVDRIKDIVKLNRNIVSAVLIATGCDMKRRWNYHHEKLAIARKHKYESPDAMLVDLYCNKKMNSGEVGAIMEVTSSTVRFRLNKLNIKCRKCGGLNNVKLDPCMQAEIKGIPKLTKTIIIDLAAKYSVIPATILNCHMGVTYREDVI